MQTGKHTFAGISTSVTGLWEYWSKLTILLPHLNALCTNEGHGQTGTVGAMPYLRRQAGRKVRTEHRANSHQPSPRPALGSFREIVRRNREDGTRILCAANLGIQVGSRHLKSQEHSASSAWESGHAWANESGAEPPVGITQECTSSFALILCGRANLKQSVPVQILRKHECILVLHQEFERV